MVCKLSKEWPFFDPERAAKLTGMLNAASSIMIVGLLVLGMGKADAQNAPAAATQFQSQNAGRHDFDWEFGTWKTRVRILRNPLSGQAPDWAEYQGTSVVRPVSGGQFNLVELSVAGNRGRIEGASLRLYEPEAHRWSLNFANVRNGHLTAPVYGAFDRRGRGIFFANDTLDGRPILVRFLITPAASGEAHFEQAYSPDLGKTWEVNWIAVDRKRARARNQ